MACRRSNCPNYHPHAEELCEPCEEFANQVHREEYGVLCLHCQSTFTPGGFKKHGLRIYYRTKEFPLGRRIAL